MRILLGAFGDAGHAFPMIALGKRLVERGHEVTLQTWRRWENHVEREGMTFSPSPEYHVFPTKGKPMKPYSAAVRAAQETVPLVDEVRPHACVSDILTLAPAWAAEMRDVPVATLVPHLCPDTEPGAPPFSFGARLPRTRAGRGLWQAMDPLVRKGLENGRRDCNDARDRLGLAPLEQLHTGLSRSLTLIGTLPQLEYPRTWPSWMRVVGPLMWEPPGEEVLPPPGEGPVVLVAPSTAHDAEHEMLRSALTGLAAEPVRVIATWNGREPPWLGSVPVPDNAVLVPWVSYSRTMPHCDVVVTHGGHGTLMRALTQGCTAVVCPAAGDMFENAARVDWSGVGVRLPRRLLTPTGLRLAVRRALDTPRFRTRARGMAAWSAAHDGVDTACREIEDWISGRERTVVVVDPDPYWGDAFEREAARLRPALDGTAVRIEHIGSTAVPDVPAKPTIDVQVSVDRIDVEDLRARLEPLGYRYIPWKTTDSLFFAHPATGRRRHHVHVCLAGSDDEHRILALRDYLRAHPAEAAGYGLLKQDLAKRFAGNRAGYIAAKDGLVKTLQARAVAWAEKSPEELRGWDSNPQPTG